MKKLLICFWVYCFVLMSSMAVSAKEQTIALTNITQSQGVTVSAEGIQNPRRGAVITLGEVDMTGLQSLWVRADVTISASGNGETLGVLVDDPNKGDIIGYLVLTQNGAGQRLGTALKPVDGTHTMYLVGTYGGNDTSVTLTEITFSTDAYVLDAEKAKVPDSAVRDAFFDTWEATDDLGRHVADFDEAGALKAGERAVGMLYWNWFGSSGGTGTVISDILKDAPEAKDDYTHPAWPKEVRTYWWGEPVLGFYNASDIWVLRRHAEMLAAAGVDVIFFDYTNGGSDYLPLLDHVAEAFRAAKKSGVKVPKISAMTDWGNDDGTRGYRGLTALYFHCFVENDYSDIWYYYEDKPLLFGSAVPQIALRNAQSSYETRVLSEEIGDFFTYRMHGSRNNPDKEGWMWLENFPQILRGVGDDGRPEFVSVGTAINQSTVLGKTETGAFSDPYSKGRGYSEAFGEDYSEQGKRMGWFFREQAALALAADPHFVMLDGWNEWIAIRNATYGSFKNAFVDTFDEENSRDFEPGRTALKDDYYNLLVDFVRKYKGVRRAPVAQNAKTIVMDGSLSQWENIEPTFYNLTARYDRVPTSENYPYRSRQVNVIERAKVSYDEERLYFLAQCDAPIEKNEAFMHLFIDADRNHATGLEGYDVAVNVTGEGDIALWENGAWIKKADAQSFTADSNYTVAVPRFLLGEAEEIDIEFKWTDAVAADDVLEFYAEGSVAPLGRFNYHYWTKEAPSLSEAQRNSLKTVSVLKAGAANMIVSGALEPVFEADRRVTAVMNGETLYVPQEAVLELLGYGRGKTEYLPYYNRFLTYRFTMNESLTAMNDVVWTYTTLGSNEVRINGRSASLSHPVYAEDGRLWVPLTYLEECHGMTITPLGDDAYALSDGNLDVEAAKQALSCL